jgi:hypothetical protein
LAVETAAVTKGFDLTAVVDYNLVDSTQKTEMNTSTQVDTFSELPKGATSAVGSPLEGVVSAVVGEAGAAEVVSASKTLVATVSAVAKKLLAQEGTLDPPISGSGSDEAKNTAVIGTEKKQTIHAALNSGYGNATLFKAGLKPVVSEGFKQATDAGDTWGEQLTDAIAPYLDDQPWPTDMTSAYASQNSGITYKCSCIGARQPDSKTESNSVHCVNSGGDWRCVETAVAKSISGDTYNHKKNVELSTMLPSKGAFDVSKITG